MFMHFSSTNISQTGDGEIVLFTCAQNKVYVGIVVIDVPSIEI